MFTAKNENELLQLLKVISEEAVGDAKRRLNEKADLYASNFKSRLESTPFSIKEQEEEAEVKANPPEEKEAEEATDGKEEPSKTEVPTNFGASIDSLQKNINALRAGKSLKDSTVNNQLQIYYDKLTESEREVLVLFLRELSRILSGAVSGDDAVDPSDPPPGLNVDIISKDKQKPEQAPAQNQAPQQQPAPQKRVVTGDKEDTTPPIRVNESQDVAALRKKLKLLFRG